MFVRGSFFFGSCVFIYLEFFRVFYSGWGRVEIFVLGVLGLGFGEGRSIFL